MTLLPDISDSATKQSKLPKKKNSKLCFGHFTNLRTYHRFVQSILFHLIIQNYLDDSSSLLRHLLILLLKILSFLFRKVG